MIYGCSKRIITWSAIHAATPPAGGIYRPVLNLASPIVSVKTGELSGYIYAFYSSSITN
jgi:hypothetical protein